MNTCEHCQHAEKIRQAHEIQKSVVCTRFPPTAHLIPQQGGIGVMTVFPQVSTDQHCGEFLQRINVVNLPN